MAVLVTDKFRRADNDAVGNDSNGNAWVEVSGDSDISGNGLIQTDALTTPGLVRCGTNPADDDHWLEAQLARSDGTGQIGLSLRVDASAFTAVQAEVADGAYKEIEVVAGSPVTGETGAAHTHVSGEIYAAEVVAATNTFRLYLDGVQVFTFTNPNLTANTRVGLHLNESASGAVKWANFRAGNGLYPGLDVPWKDRKTEVGTSLGANNAMPAFTGAAAGDLAIWCVAVDNPSTTDITGSTGWTKIVPTATAGSNIVKACWFARILDGGANDTLQVTSATQDYCAQGVLVAAAKHSVVTLATDIKVATAATATSGSANPPSLNTGASGNWLFLASGAVDATTGNLISSGPTNMSLVGQPLRSASSTSSVMLGMSYEVQTGSTLDPGTFENPTQEWVGQTIAVPVPAGEVTGTGTPAEGDDTAAGSGLVGAIGSGAPAEGNDTATGAGQLAYTGTGSPAETNDTAAGAGQLAYTGAGTPAEGNDTATGSGQLGYSGSAAPAEGDDTATGSGTVTGGGISGAGSPTEGNDTATGSGQLAHTGAGAPAEGDDTAAGSGQLGYMGAGAPTEGLDTAAGAGQLAYTGAGAPAEAPDTATGTGTVTGGGPVTPPPPLEGTGVQYLLGARGQHDPAELAAGAHPPALTAKGDHE